MDMYNGSKYLEIMKTFVRDEELLFILNNSVLSIELTGSLSGYDTVSNAIFNLSKDAYIKFVNNRNYENIINELLVKIIPSGDRIEIREVIYNFDEELQVIPNSEPKKVYDVFISHASANKTEYVNDLVTELNKYKNIKIWYDTQNIDWGDDQVKEIYDGLEKCEFGIVIITKEFMEREWTNKELETLLSRQNNSGQKLILPILHNISISDYFDKYPKLKNIFALDTSKFSIQDICIKFVDILLDRLKKH